MAATLGMTLGEQKKCSRTSIIRTRITPIPRKLELNFLSLDQNLTENYPDNSNSSLTRTVFRFPSEFELTGFYRRNKGASCCSNATLLNVYIPQLEILVAALNLQSSYLITTSCCWISFFSFSSDCVTSSKTGCVFLYLDANISASLIWSEAVKQFTLPKKLPTWRPTQLAKMTTDLTGWRRTSWLFTRVAEKLNSGLPRTIQ